ncbi:armadillo-type protein [Naematelia encephala]|uniref:Eukaryotic translation initiation factor 3 subunit K n=1 Tax=Naematelia encephala TaxID=71784 RepID=A0A1Y2B199_9TREE|nr:armadillo-type protein [Naematelia encephala]
MSQVTPLTHLKAWHSPESRTDVIQELIHGVDRYNPSNLSWMEEYLGTQVQTGEYDLFANLAILKLYQFNPQLSNPDVIINILIKALSATVHGPDFNLCLSLLREPATILSEIETEDQSLGLVMPLLQNMHELSRTCQFTAFWKEFNSESEASQLLRNTYVPQHANLIESLRNIFAASISSCFSAIPLVRLQRWLDIPAGEIHAWCSNVGWNVDGEVAAIPKNGDNDVKAGVVKEHVELSQLTKLVAAAAY